MKMNRFAIALTACVSVLLPFDAATRITRECNTNFGTGELIIQANEENRREILAITANPARNPDVFERLWQPKRGRETTYLAFENEVILGYDKVQDTEEMAATIRADPVLATFGIRSVSPNTTRICFSGGPPPAPVTITEYHNRFLNHYFMSSSAAENAIIDSGGAGEGWERTGEAFAAVAQDYCAASRPVFRFYGLGANSHFFTVDTAECGGLRIQDPGWQYEGEAFGAMLPTLGACPGRTRPLYRLYNNRAALNDSNHRFVSRLELYAEMQARGWIGEGVAMCLATSGSDWWQNP